MYQGPFCLSPPSTVHYFLSWKQPSLQISSQDPFLCLHIHFVLQIAQIPPRLWGFNFLEPKPSVDLSLSYTYPLRDDQFQTKCLKRKMKEEHSTFPINYVILPTNGSGLFPAHSSLVSCLPFSWFILVVISRLNTLSLALSANSWITTTASLESYLIQPLLSTREAFSMHL